MDFMDIDQVVEVPDTPDRLAAIRNSDGNGIGKETDASTNNRVVSKDYTNERFRKQSMEKGKSVIINGNRRLFTHPNGCSNPQVSLSNSRSFTNGLSTVDTPRYEKGKALLDSNVQKSTCQEDSSFVDMYKQNGSANGFKKATSTGALRNGKVHASRKGRLPVNSFSAVEALDTSRELHKSDNALKIGPSFDIGEGVDFIGQIQQKVKNNASALLPPSVSSRVTGQKRLVRNGCISPHNIAKSKKVVEEHDNGCVAKEVKGDAGATASVGPSTTVDIKDLIAEAKDSVRSKGKGISRHPSSFEEPDARSRHLSLRSSVTLKEATDGGSDIRDRVDASRYFKESDGWRTTHNRRKEDLPFVDGDSHKSKGNDTSSSAIDHQRNEVLQRERRNGRVPSSLNDHLEDLQIVSSSRRAHNLGQFKERAQLTKRQRHKAAPSNIGECSTSRFNDSEIVILSPSGESSSSRPTRNKNLHRAGTSNTVITLDELSSEERNRSSNRHHSNNEDSNVRDLQLEADEMLARELQEQFYSEEPEPSAGIDEMNSNLAFAMAIQQDDSIQHAIPAGGRQASRLSGSSVFNLPQQSRSNASRNPSVRRGIQSQAPTSTRFARLRGRFQGRSRRISSAARNSIFPPNMDVDMRMQILEALEAVGEMEVPNDLLQVDRDFNENDYDMLLALDENNHHHGGATRAQINNLPQSLVQSENLQECAICLETPTIGETVRHLPCLHKFHKDCIDQWLRRKTSCPVCKSSVT